MPNSAAEQFHTEPRMPDSEQRAFVDAIIAAFRAATPQLTEDERQWVRMVIQREAEIARFRKAVIEKSLGGLLWAGLVGLGYVVLDWLKNHGFRI